MNVRRKDDRWLVTAPSAATGSARMTATFSAAVLRLTWPLEDRVGHIAGWCQHGLELDELPAV